jgi:hypothetical protein
MSTAASLFAGGSACIELSSSRGQNCPFLSPGFLLTELHRLRCESCVHMMRHVETRSQSA